MTKIVSLTVTVPDGPLAHNEVQEVFADMHKLADTYSTGNVSVSLTINSYSDELDE